MTAAPSSRAGQGIGFRLGVAFALSALLAVVACGVGWLSYERLSLSIRQIGERDLPAAAASARIAQIAGGVTASAPLLAQSATPEQVEQAAARLSGRLGDMRNVLAGQAAPSGGTVQIIERLAANLDAIRRQTLAQIALRQENDRLLREVRALHSDFVEEAEPLIDDARFFVQSTLERLDAGGVAPRDGARDIRSRVRNAESILQASSHANLAVGLMSRIASVGALEQLNIDDHFLAETIDLVRGQLSAMEDTPDTITVRQILGRLIDLSVGADSLSALRRGQLAAAQATLALLAENRTLLRDLDQQVAGIVDAASERAAASGEAAARAIATGRNILALIAALSVIAALSMGLIYVRGSVISRLSALAEAARMLAAGRVPPPIEIRGSDELSDLARAVESFRRTQNDLVQSAKLAALGHLSAGIAHELNQPLNAIRAQAHNAAELQERGDLAGAARSLRKVQDLTARAGLVVNQLRRFARRSDQQLGPVAVREAVEGAAVILASRLKECGVSLFIDLPAGIVAEADEIRLEQVFVNLMGNALDAVTGRPDPEIRVLGERRNNVVKVTVEDNGPGLSPEVAGSLFDPFVTTKPPGQGVGLGLTLSYNIIRDFGGALSSPPRAVGAAFVIELRAAEEAKA